MTMNVTLRQLLKLMLLPLVVAGPVERTRPSGTLPSRVSHDKTLHARVDPSPYPYGDAAPGEFLWLGWDPDNEDQKKRGEKIHKAFIEWGEMAKLAVKEAANHDSEILKRWFDKQDDQSETEGVFANMWDTKADAPGKAVAKMVLEQTDFSKKCSDTIRAYTLPDSGRFHVCPRGDNSKLNADIKCDDLDDSCSSKMRSLPMTILHEMTHFNDIGAAARGDLAIIDEDNGKGAYDCFKLGKDEKGDNAQNYAWFAGEVYWSNKCSKKFKDPEAGIKAAVGQDEGEPTINGPSSAQCSNSDIKFSVEEAKKAIDSFCNDPNLPPTMIVPQVSFGTGQTDDKRGKALGNSNEGVAINGGADTLWLGAHFAENSCMGSWQFGGETCVTELTKILDQCPGDDKSKSGGAIQDVCAVHRMLVTKAGEPSPLWIQAVAEGDIMGDWVCEPMDTSALGPDSGLDGTCVCHYSNQPSLTDLFVPPKAGDCGSVERGASPKIN